MGEKKEYELGRKTPKEVIESEGSGEHTYVKAPRGELVPISKEIREYVVESDVKKEMEFLAERGGIPHFSLHTHPYSPKSFAAALPSPTDLIESFTGKEKFRKAEIIAQKDSKTGEFQGYTFLHRKKSSSRGYEKYQSLFQLEKSIDPAHMTPSGYYERLLRAGKEAGFDIRLHPAKGYYFNRDTGSYEKKPAHSLEGAVGSTLIGFTILFLLIRVPQLTGLVVSNPSLGNYKEGLFLITGFLFSLIVYFMFRIFGRGRLR